MDGILLINKPKNMTSFDVVSIVKKKLNTKKVGHTGTLDPDTTGLLVLCVNRATKFIPFITKDSKKEYVTKMKLGIKTDTGDMTGKIIAEDKKMVLENDLLNSLKSFEKSYNQIPPKYSAKKINGKKAYDLARNNKEFELKPCRVSIYKNNLIRISNEIEFSTLVSKGTYVRSLIEDIADDLGTIATMTSLIRTKTDGFDIKDAIEIDEISYENMISLSDFCKSKYQCVETDNAFQISNGVAQEINEEYNYPILYVNNNQLIALYDKKESKAKVAFMFNASN